MTSRERAEAFREWFRARAGAGWTAFDARLAAQFDEVAAENYERGWRGAEAHLELTPSPIHGPKPPEPKGKAFHQPAPPKHTCDTPGCGQPAPYSHIGWNDSPPRNSCEKHVYSSSRAPELGASFNRHVHSQACRPGCTMLVNHNPAAYETISAWRAERDAMVEGLRAQTATDVELAANFHPPNCAAGAESIFYASSSLGRILHPAWVIESYVESLPDLHPLPKFSVPRELTACGHPPSQPHVMGCQPKLVMAHIRELSVPTRLAEEPADSFEIKMTAYLGPGPGAMAVITGKPCHCGSRSIGVEKQNPDYCPASPEFKG